MTLANVMLTGPEEESLLFRGGLRPIKAQKLPYFNMTLQEWSDPSPMAPEHFDQAGS